MSVMQLLALVSLFAGLSSEATPSCSPELPDVEFRIIMDWREFYGVRDPWQRWDVSVNRWLTREEFDQLVCCLVRVLDPPEEWEALRLHIYRDIDDIGILIRGGEGLEPDGTIKAERTVGYYWWSRYWAEMGRGGKVTLEHDGLGQATYTTYLFNHTLHCPRSGPAEP
jgi:hypothetical protein